MISVCDGLLKEERHPTSTTPLSTFSCVLILCFTLCVLNNISVTLLLFRILEKMLSSSLYILFRTDGPEQKIPFAELLSVIRRFLRWDVRIIEPSILFQVSNNRLCCCIEASYRLALVLWPGMSGIIEKRLALLPNKSDRMIAARQVLQEIGRWDIRTRHQ